MERPQQVTSFQTLNFRNMDTRPREGSEGTSIPNLPKHHTYKSRTSCEMEESFGLLPGSPGKKLELEEGEAKIGGMEKSAASIYGHLASCGLQNLNEDEVTDPFPGGKAILKRGGQEAPLRARCGQSWCWQPNWALPVPGRLGRWQMPPT